MQGTVKLLRVEDDFFTVLVNSDMLSLDVSFTRLLRLDLISNQGLANQKSFKAIEFSRKFKQFLSITSLIIVLKLSDIEVT